MLYDDGLGSPWWPPEHASVNILDFWGNGPAKICTIITKHSRSVYAAMLSSSEEEHYGNLGGY